MDLSNLPKELYTKLKSVELKRMVSDGQRERGLTMENDRYTKQTTIQYEGLAQGQYAIEFWFKKSLYGISRSFWHSVFRFTLDSGEHLKPTISFLSAPMPKLGRITLNGQLVDATGQPLKDRVVRLIPFTEKTYGKIAYPDTITNAKGSFRFKHVDPSGPYLVAYQQANGTLAERNLSKDFFSLRDEPLVIMDQSTIKQIQNKLAITGATVTDLNGKDKNIQDFRGQILVIKFWASYCGPCRRSMPKYLDLATSPELRKVLFLTVSVDYYRGLWKKTLDENKWHGHRHFWLNPLKNPAPFGRRIPYYAVTDNNGGLFVMGDIQDIRTTLKILTD